MAWIKAFGVPASWEDWNGLLYTWTNGTTFTVGPNSTANSTCSMKTKSIVSGCTLSYSITANSYSHTTLSVQVSTDNANWTTVATSADAALSGSVNLNSYIGSELYIRVVGAYSSTSSRTVTIGSITVIKS